MGTNMQTKQTFKPAIDWVRLFSNQLKETKMGREEVMKEIQKAREKIQVEKERRNKWERYSKVVHFLQVYDQKYVIQSGNELSMNAIETEVSRKTLIVLPFFFIFFLKHFLKPSPTSRNVGKEKQATSRDKEACVRFLSNLVHLSSILHVCFQIPK